MKKTVVVIGGGAGGMTTATQIKKQDPEIRVVLFEKGPHVSWAGCPTPYFIADQLPEESVIHFTPEYFIKNRDIEVYVHHEVTGLDWKNKSVQVRGTEVNGDFAYDNLVLSMGAVPFIPPIEGIDSRNLPEGIFTLRNASDAFTIKEFIKSRQPKQGVIIGAGPVGLEMAEAFRHYSIETTVIELMPEILPFLENRQQRKIVDGIIQENKINLLTGSQVIRIDGNTSAFRLTLKDGNVLDADIVLLAIGIRPNLELLKTSGFPLSDGKLSVNEKMETEVEGVYALGDMVWNKHLLTGKYIYTPLGDVADKQAIVVGNNITGDNLSFKGVIGSASTSLFKWQIARTGLTLKEAEENGFEAESAMVRAYPRVPGFAGTETGIVNVIHDRKRGILLGATIVAPECASQFIDQFAIVISRKIPVAEVFDIDYAYSPTTAVVWNPLLAVYRKILNR